MQLEHLKYVAEIAKHRSIRKAAESLYLSPSSLSTCLKSMEKQFGYAIFKRYSFGVVPTEKGQKLLDDLYHFLPVFDSWFEQSKAYNNDLSGQINISIQPILAKFFSWDIERMLNQKYPSLKINFYEDRTNSAKTLLPILKKNNVRIVLTCVPNSHIDELTQSLTDTPWQIELCGQEKTCVFFCAKHPMARIEKLELADLKNLPLTFFPSATINPKTKTSLFYDPIFPYLSQYQGYSFSNFDKALAMVADNQASILHHKLLLQQHEFYKSGKLVAYDLPDIPNFSTGLSYVVIYPSEENISVIDKVVVNEIKEFFDHFKF